MVAFEYGDLGVGGAFGFIEHMKSDGTFVRRIVQNDDHGNPLVVNGISFTSQGDMLSVVSIPLNAVDYAPHDIVVLPDQTGYLVLLSKVNDSAYLRKYNMNGTILNEWNIQTDTWDHTKVMRIDVACDNDTVYYTTQGRTIFKFSLTLGTNLDSFAQLPSDSPYSYNAFKLFTNGSIIVDATGSGNGPKYALCIDSSLDKIWTDEINPTGAYHVIQRLLSDGSELHRYVTKLDASNNDHPVTALGCYVFVCPLAGVARYSQADLSRIWFTRT